MCTVTSFVSYLSSNVEGAAVLSEPDRGLLTASLTSQLERDPINSSHWKDTP